MPDLTDLSKEPESTFELYGPDSRKPGTYAANCLMARRLAERGVRFIQLYHRGWDQHNDLPRDLGLQCKGTDQASAALVPDLKQRGLLDDTLVIWGGEFGRTVYSQGQLTKDKLRPRPSSPLLRHVVRRRRHQARHHLGETDDYSLQRSVRSCARSMMCRRPCCTASASITRGYLQIPGRHFRLTDVGGNVTKQMLA